jgi:AcrR family transcriptional regulator
VAEATTEGPRQRYRRQVRAEVQEHAWRQIAEAGASGLSLKAIAGLMGITAPALYRYFASRDDLLTELILATYRDLAELVEETAGAVDPAPERIASTAQAIRAWALANPHRYLLIYGTPVPGYAAPPEATALAGRIFAPFVEAFSVARTGADGPLAPDQAFRRSLLLWTRLHGVISLEVAGHFAGMPFDPAQLFADEVEATLECLTWAP